MNHLALHPQTKAYVVQYIEQHGHALLLIGDNGIGKTALASVIAAGLLEIPEDQLVTYPYFTVISPKDNTISIDAIRQLQHFLQLKTFGKNEIRRVVIVEHSEYMSTEAQNAFLKLLEEPPADTSVILTVHNKRALLPTILSRTQTLTVRTPAQDATKEFFVRKGIDPAKVTQAYFLSGGLPGLMYSLVTDGTDHPLTDGVAVAKEILQKKTFERLLLIEKLSKKREAAISVIEALQHIAQVGIEQAAAKADTAKLKQWHHILKVTAEAASALDKSANIKLVLCDTMLRI